MLKDSQQIILFRLFLQCPQLTCESAYTLDLLSDSVRELMTAFFELLQTEFEPAVRVILGHSIFVYVHPSFEGNGCMGR